MHQSHDPASASHDVASRLDVLSDVLRSVRLTGAMLFLIDASTPWVSWAPKSEDFREVVLPASQHLVSFHVVTLGHCWAGASGAPPERFDTGDVLVVPHGDAYVLANPPGATPTYEHDQAVAFFRRMAAGELPSLVSEGGGGTERTEFICGFLGCDVRPFNPVIAALPTMLHLRGATRADDPMRHLIDFARCELREPRSGSPGVLLRLAELMFVEAVRRHLETMSRTQTGWLAGLHDPLVARTLTLLHRAAARHWTLDALAAQVGSSRSVLAERFSHLVGQPPMHYLAQWRMQLAARMLADSRAKVAAVADAVGYESEAAFSRAFKKSVGVAPGAWRRHDAQGAVADPLRPRRK